MSGLSPYSTVLATASKPIPAWFGWFLKILGVATILVLASVVLVAIASAVFDWSKDYAFQYESICMRAVIVVLGIWALLLCGVFVYHLFIKWED